jgi:hypothetical protein
LEEPSAYPVGDLIATIHALGNPLKIADHLGIQQFMIFVSPEIGEDLPTRNEMQKRRFWIFLGHSERSGIETAGSVEEIANSRGYFMPIVPEWRKSGRFSQIQRNTDITSRAVAVEGKPRSDRLTG